MKEYKEMTRAEKEIMDYLQIYSYQRANAKTEKGREMSAIEELLWRIARAGGLIE